MATIPATVGFLGWPSLVNAPVVGKHEQAFRKGFILLGSAFDHLQQVVCMDVVRNLAMHRIQQVHRNGAWDRGYEKILLRLVDKSYREWASSWLDRLRVVVFVLYP